MGCRADLQCAERARLPIAPSTYYDYLTGAVGAATSATSSWAEHIIRVHTANYGVYGARKVWLQLNREHIQVARCAVERLMRRLGLAGAVRGKVKRTTIADPATGWPWTWSAATSPRWRRTGCGWPT